VNRLRIDRAMYSAPGPIGRPNRGITDVMRPIKHPAAQNPEMIKSTVCPILNRFGQNKLQPKGKMLYHMFINKGTPQNVILYAL